jgi:RNA polymerase sigma-70 factor (ECF subfamily)
LAEVNEEREQINQCLAGKREAFVILVKKYQKPIFNYLFHMSRDYHLASDLTQEVFLKAFVGLKTFNPNKKFSNWLYKISHNLFIDWYRRKKNSLTTVSLNQQQLPANITNSSSHLDEIINRQLIVSALNQLSLEHKSLLILKYFQQLSYKEISEVTGLKLSQLKSKLFQARRQLAQLMENNK